MEAVWTRENIRSLQNLLRDPELEDNSDQDDVITPMSKMKPGDIGPKCRSEVKKEKPNVKQKNPDDIWDIDEIPEGTQHEDIYDPRPQPKYEIVYQQAVTAEDVYLQLGRKNPTTACCEYMIVKVILPDTRLSDIILDVKETFLDLRAPKYYHYFDNEIFDPARLSISLYYIYQILLNQIQVKQLGMKIKKL
ncbi:unnamed protein product [Schistosoma intercalatum]|nr:unnamed protein product [Schistosoma intercalatum]CAH8499039.1 unnamed protein product [Schistosoma intercalatum]